VQIAVGRRDVAHVDAPGPNRADSTDLATLEDAKQLRLDTQRQLAHFVEEEGASLGRLDETGPARDRAREGAFLVAEQLALEQGLRKLGAVEGDERSAASRRIVHGAGEDFLSRSGLAQHHDWQGARSHHVEHGVQAAHDRVGRRGGRCRPRGLEPRERAVHRKGHPGRVYGPRGAEFPGRIKEFARHRQNAYARAVDEVSAHASVDEGAG
jgi:hypothetical protein